MNNLNIEIKEVGYVILVKEFLVRVSELSNVSLREVVKFENGAIGMVFTIFEDSVDILIIENHTVKIGEAVYPLGYEISTQVPANLGGMVLDSLGNNKLVQRTENSTKLKPVMTEPIGIWGRSNITKGLDTGVAIVDATVPLGSGQRELVVGDRKTGKTQFLLQVLKQQALNGRFCIYASIGKKEIEVLELIDFIKKSNISPNVCVVSSTISDGLGKIFLTPYTAMTLCEEIRNSGHDVLLIIDDLTSHAQFYREISLTAKRFPGRAAYPGNIFHLHSILMERAGNFSVNGKDVSITCLPVCESTFGDIAGYITTNLMSMTDGHIYLDSEIFDQGRRPAVNPFLSVTRVGHQTQSALVREISREITSLLIEYREAQDFSHFGAEASDNVRATLLKGQIVYEIFDQQPGTIIPTPLSFFLLIHLLAGTFKGQTPEGMRNNINTAINKYISDKSFKDNVDAALRSPNLKTVISDIEKYPILQQ